MKLENNLKSRTGWEIFEDTYIPEQSVTTGSNYMIGNGYLGYRGTFADDRAEDYVACVVTDTYDNADGVWKELVSVPNGAYSELKIDGEKVRWAQTNWARYRRELDFRYGVWTAEGVSDRHGVSITEERYVSAADIHLLVSRTIIQAHRSLDLTISTGIDGAVWSLNGDHFASKELVEFEGDLEADVRTIEHGYDLVVRERSRITVNGKRTGTGLVSTSDEKILRRVTISLDAGQTVTLTRFMAIYSTNDLREGPNPHTSVEVPPAPAATGTIDPAKAAADARSRRKISDDDRPSLAAIRDAAASTLERAEASGWDALIDAHRTVWDERWNRCDIEIDGDDFSQTVLRYNLYHNFIATPMHSDHLPIGARGLSCQAYQGAAFWDQEIFNLPMFIFTAPEIARNILIYRYKTLDGARRKARDLGYEGAFYAWISGDSGEEICPAYFFTDLVSGRPIRNHFNDWQVHISPDIAYTIRRYVAVTGDDQYLHEYGAEIVFEIARFLASCVLYRTDRERYEMVRVLGPDEYHENVDNNFFTNYQTRFAVGYAVEVYRQLESEERSVFGALKKKIGLETEEVRLWEDIAMRMFVPEPDPESGVIEQFAGFFQHEDVTPGEIKERLIEPGEYWGWPNGIACATQVSKQADVTQLFALHPTAYTRETMRVNWEYYEPRTQHGSSLSPAVYAIVAAWVGHTEEAKRYFAKSCTVDLYKDNKAVSGGTFIGGIHTAACGISWQIVVLGFAGMHLTDDGFAFDPRLPEGWDRLRIRLERWGSRITVTFTRDGTGLTVSAAADAKNETKIGVTVGPCHAEVLPGEAVQV